MEIGNRNAFFFQFERNLHYLTVFECISIDVTTARFHSFVNFEHNAVSEKPEKNIIILYHEILWIFGTAAGLPLTFFFPIRSQI